MDTLSTLAVFDDLRRCEAVVTDGTAENEFLEFTLAQNNCRLHWLSAVSEAQRLQRELDSALANIADLETKLYHARRIIEMEKKHRKDAELEREINEKKISHVRELVRNERDLKAEMRDKFAFLNSSNKKRKSTQTNGGGGGGGNEMNSTGSLLSDLSVTQSEDDFLDVCKAKKWKKHRPSLSDHANSFNGTRRSRISNAGEKRKSNNIAMEIGPTDKLVARTKVSIPQGNEPIQAESIIEAIPQQHQDKENQGNGNTYERRSAKISTLFTPTSGQNNEMKNGSRFISQKTSLIGRQHVFGTKTLMKSDTCVHCQKKIRFGTVGLKCRDCRVYVHPSCKDFLTLVCVPQSGGTPIQKGVMDVIANYAPSEPPMVPALIVHCINEIERRGFNEVGIYRVSGSEKDIKALKERFLRGKSVPALGNIDVHVLCGCIKDFLRGLREPLIPTALWKNFSNAVHNVDSVESLKELDQAIQKLPRANRDTLAFLILHFLRVANCATIKMPISNLAKVFGPTIIGYSSLDPDQHAIFTETMIQANVMERLLDMPTEYWSNFLSIEINNKNDRDGNSYNCARATPSKQYFGTPILHNTTKKKFYDTPPYSTLKRK